jgi:ribose transport system substrate-binding protein
VLAKTALAQEYRLFIDKSFSGSYHAIVSLGGQRRPAERPARGTAMGMNSSRGSRRSVRKGVAALAVAALVLAACGDDDDDGGSSATTAASGSATTAAGSATTAAGGNDLEAIMAAGYAGSFEPPPESGPPAQAGKNVWYISCGEAFLACADMSRYFQEAGEALGWDVTVVDGAASPDTATTLIRQAVAAKADAIVTNAFDCPAVKSGLLEAKEAGIVTMTLGSYDCDDPQFGGGESLYTGIVKMLGSTSAGELFAKWSERRAEYIAGKLEPNGGGKVLEINETGQVNHQAMSKAFKARLAELCPSCELVDVPFEFSQVPTESSQIFQSALLANPDAKALAWDTDALMGLGLETVIKQSAPEGMLLAGGEGLSINIDAIRNGTQDSAVLYPFEWTTWGVADSLNRIFAGEDPKSLPSQGGGFIFIDEENNLPPEGEQPTVPVDFKSMYKKVWAGS